MKRLILLIFLFFVLNLSLPAQICGDTLTVQGKKILKVWGSHYDRGYAHGYLLGDQIRDIAVDYFIGSFLLYNPLTYDYCRNYFDEHFQIDYRYFNEAQGMIDGMTDTGVEMYVEEIDKYLEPEDVLMANSLVDLYNLYFINSDLQFGCSSLSAWGESTIADEELQGNLVITRNMDWSASQILIDNHLLIVNLPTEENEISWVSFSFAGMIGALSGINSSGTAAFMNVGNINTVGDDAQLHPIFFSIRDGLEHYDYNYDGEQNEMDVVSSISDRSHLTGSIVHAVHDPDAVVIESNNFMGSAIRTVEDNTSIPDFNLVATNHFRVLYPPMYCFRYNAFTDSLENSIQQSIFRNWNITAGAGGVTSNLHSIQFVPSLDLIKWSTADHNTPAYLQEPAVFDLQDLLTVETFSDEMMLAKESILLAGPNPLSSGTTLYFNPQGNIEVNLAIYNIKGQKIRDLLKNEIIHPGSSIHWDGKNDAGEQVVSGIYFYDLNTQNSRERGRLVIIK